MSQSKLLIDAKSCCIKFHEGQVRKKDGSAYSTHPIAVQEILVKYGYDDEVTQCIALLHDVIEDTPATYEDLKDRFGEEIAQGVRILSKNMDEGLVYEEKILRANEIVQRVKIADMIHNTRDLDTLRPASIQRKIDMAKSVYIPLGEKIAPRMVKELQFNVNSFLEKNPYFQAELV